LAAFDIQDLIGLAGVAVFRSEVKDTPRWTIKAILLILFDKRSIDWAASQVAADGTLEYIDFVVAFGDGAKVPVLRLQIGLKEAVIQIY
jgi:hypothetical protein